MKRFVNLVLLFLICATIHAQAPQKKLDSLLRLIRNLPISDTVSINLRNQYLKQALFVNPTDTSLMDFAHTTLEISTKNHYPKGSLMAYERLALIQQYSFSNPYTALDYYQKARSIATENSSLEMYKWGIIGNIATLYYEQEEYEKALHSFKEILHHGKNLRFIATANIGNVYGSMEKTDSAIYFYQKALAYPEAAQQPFYQANLYSNLSLMYEKTGETKTALRLTKKSLDLVEAHDLALLRPTAYANAAMVFLKNKEYEKAGHYAKKSLKRSEKLGNLFLEKSAWGTLAEVYAVTGSYKNAYDAHVEYSLRKDSLTNQNRRVEISRKQMAYDFEQERTRAQEELQRQTSLKRTSIVGGIGLLAASIFGFFVYKRRRDVVAQKNEAEFSALVADTELKVLRLQMNPHFIFNSLNSIGDYLHKNNTLAAQDYLSLFAKLMRNVLENSEHPEISLQEEIDFIRLYMEVETMRLPKKFSYSIEVDEQLDLENILVPPLILQPFIENSIWHGFNSEKKQGHIRIGFTRKNKMILCSVDDNGAGRRPNETLTNRKSMGIALTENRIKILNKKNKMEGALRILDKPQHAGTHIEVSLPLQNAF